MLASSLLGPRVKSCPLPGAPAVIPKQVLHRDNDPRAMMIQATASAANTTPGSQANITRAGHRSLVEQNLVCHQPQANAIMTERQILLAFMKADTLPHLDGPSSSLARAMKGISQHNRGAYAYGMHLCIISDLHLYGWTEFSPISLRAPFPVKFCSGFRFHD